MWPEAKHILNVIFKSVKVKHALEPNYKNFDFWGENEKWFEIVGPK